MIGGRLSTLPLIERTMAESARFIWKVNWLIVRQDGPDETCHWHQSGSQYTQYILLCYHTYIVNYTSFSLIKLIKMPPKAIHWLVIEFNLIFSLKFYYWLQQWDISLSLVHLFIRNCHKIRFWRHLITFSFWLCFVCFHWNCSFGK